MLLKLLNKYHSLLMFGYDKSLYLEDKFQYKNAFLAAKTIIPNENKTLIVLEDVEFVNFHCSSKYNWKWPFKNHEKWAVVWMVFEPIKNKITIKCYKKNTEMIKTHFGIIPDKIHVMETML